jgi:hypothetical protein
MEDRLSRFLFATYDSYAIEVSPTVSSIQGLTDAVIEINGLFVESKVHVRGYIISIHANSSSPGKINHVRRPPFVLGWLLVKYRF